MRQFLYTAITAAAMLTLTACNNSTADQKTQDASDLTSKENVQQALQKVQDNARPKADTSVPLENYQPLTSGNQLMYAYLALAGLPIDYSDIVSKASVEYSQTNDEFRKRDLLAALTPRIDAAVAQAKEQRYFQMQLNGPYVINHYDFDKKGFAVDSSLWDSGSYRYYSDNPTYKMGFTNGEQFHYMTHMSEEMARQIENMVNKHQPMELDIYGFIQEADTSSNNVKAQIVKLVLKDSRGNVLAEQS